MLDHLYSERFYRTWQKPPGLHSFHVQVAETDLQIYAYKNLYAEARELTLHCRRQIEETIETHPSFKTSLKPLRINTPYTVVADMIEKSARAGVGPMAGVAGAIAEYVGHGLLPFSEELIVENGGDIFVRSNIDRTMLVYAGEASPFRGKLRLRLRGKETPCGVCTSSGRVGHSLSLGNTDATVIIARSAVTADVFATAVGNRVREPADLEDAFRFLEKQEEIMGALILVNDRMGAWGDIELD